MRTTISRRLLSIGFNDREAKIFAADKVPQTFEFDELPPDWDAAVPYLEDAMVRVPILAELGIRPEAADRALRVGRGRPRSKDGAPSRRNLEPSAPALK